jgi:hypothetical protein
MCASPVFSCFVGCVVVVMKPGANEVYAFRVEGNTRSLTQQRNARGVAVQNAASLSDQGEQREEEQQE